MADNEIVIRAREFELSPDVEHYVQHLKDNGTLEKLAKEDRLTVDELQKTSLGKMCDIFAENIDHDMESGDIVIFPNGDFEIFTGY